MVPRSSPRSAALASILVAGLTVTAALAAGPPQTTAASLPTPTVERKAFAAVPGPDAEFLALLDRYTLRADGAVVHERRSRLQVNSYLAINRKYGETKVAYDPAVDTFEVLANHTVVPSGEVVEAPGNAVVDDQPAGAEHDPLWSGLRRKVIVHTALEPGAVIEEAWRVTRAAKAAPWLELAEATAFEPPVRARVIEVDLPAGAPLHWEATGWIHGEPQRETAAGRDVWRWTFERLSALPPEPGAPPDTPAIIASTCPNRAALERDLAQRIGAASDAPADLLAVVREADGKNPGDEIRLLGVLDAVTDRLNVAPIAPSEQHWQPRPLAEVWRSGVATPLELAAIEAAALRAVGFSASAAVASGSEGRDLDRCPTFAGLDRALLVVGWGGDGARFYDPTKPTQGGPLEATTDQRRLLVASSAVQMAGGLVWPGSNVRTLRVVAEVASDGTIQGTLEFSASGAATPHAALVRDPARLARELAGVLPEGKASNVRVAELRRSGASLAAEVEGKLPAKDGLGLVRWALPDFPAGVESKLPPPPAPGRVSPVTLPAPCRQSVEVVLRLPKGWTVAAAPATAKAGNDAGEVAISGETLPDGRVRLIRRIELRRAIVPATEAAQVRALLTAWLSPAGRELILRPPEEKAPEQKK
ncbi:MAG: DUF3857 domain-containing protein [Thermoanaerobaculales bacterium]